MVKLNGGSKNYKKHRMDFPTLEDFICWYNSRPHGSHDLQPLNKSILAKSRKHTYSEVFSNGQKNKTKTNFLPDTTFYTTSW